FTDTATTNICTLSLHDALPILERSLNPQPVDNAISRRYSLSDDINTLTVEKGSVETPEDKALKRSLRRQKERREKLSRIETRDERIAAGRQLSKREQIRRQLEQKRAERDARLKRAGQLTTHEDDTLGATLFGTSSSFVGPSLVGPLDALPPETK